MTRRKIMQGTRGGVRRVRWVLPLVAALLGLNRAAADIIETWSGSVELPDNNPSGWSYTFTPSVPNASVIDVDVTLDISGGFNGDLYAYLVHDSGFAVLLNRTGRDTGVPYGYATQGFSVTLDDDAPLVGGTTDPDIHLYGSLSPAYDGNGRLTGTWQPDARTDSPALVLGGTANRTAFLSTFDGLDSGGSWTVFIADVSAGGVSTIQEVSVELTVIPEPAGMAMVLLGGIVLWRIRLRREPPGCPKDG